jgi:ATP-dependent RNA helicase DDX5/DBP2
VVIGSTELKANHMIQQIVEVVGEHEKYPKLIKLLEQVQPKNLNISSSQTSLL